MRPLPTLRRCQRLPDRARERREIYASSMTTEIRDALSQAVEYLREHRSEAKYTDSAATAVLEDGLRVTVTGPEGAQLTTDMPKSIGGGGGLPSPGWVFCAAPAGCLAGLISKEGARAGGTPCPGEGGVCSGTDGHRIP